MRYWENGSSEKKKKKKDKIILRQPKHTFHITSLYKCYWLVEDLT